MTDPIPSLPPASSRSVTWPMVALAFVKELSYLGMMAVGAIVAMSMIAHGEGSALERLGAVIVPAVVSALAKGQPPGSPGTGIGALGSLFLLAFRRH